MRGEKTVALCAPHGVLRHQVPEIDPDMLMHEILFYTGYADANHNRHTYLI